MIIRKGLKKDIDKILSVYDSSRAFMRATGNSSQWINGYPGEEDVAGDIEEGVCFVGEEDGEILMAFAFIIGDDPTYKIIENGNWLNVRRYGTIHRLGSNGKKPGMLAACVSYCLEKISDIRVDTHEDNIPMRNGLEKLGFIKCGTIYCRDGSPRIAYQYSA